MTVYVNQWIPQVKSDDELPEKYKGLAKYQGVSAQVDNFEEAQSAILAVFNFLGPIWMLINRNRAMRLANALITLALTDEPDFLCEIDGYHWSITNEPKYEVLTKDQADLFMEGIRGR